MNYTINGIYDYAVKKVLAVDSTVYCSSYYEPVPESFPACFIECTDSITPQNGITLDAGDEQYQVTFEVQISSNKENGAMTEARKLMAAAEAAFKAMYFTEIYKAPLHNDSTKARIVARFRRRYGSGDQMPTT